VSSLERVGRLISLIQRQVSHWRSTLNFLGLPTPSQGQGLKPKLPRLQENSHLTNVDDWVVSHGCPQRFRINLFPKVMCWFHIGDHLTNSHRQTPSPFGPNLSLPAVPASLYPLSHQGRTVGRRGVPSVSVDDTTRDPYFRRRIGLATVPGLSSGVQYFSPHSRRWVT